jgi:hypothetical protein
MQPRDVLRPGYDDWTRRWYTQNDFGDRQLASRYMLLAFEKLPKLRHFEFSDYRALTRNGEALHELCNRLFGQTCTPDLLPNDDDCDDDDDARGWNSLNGCLRNLLQLPHSLDSFSIGRGDLKTWGAVHTEAVPLWQLGSEFLGPDDQWCTVFGSIRSLSLPVQPVFMDEPEFSDKLGTVQKILNFSTATITHLNLETSLYSGLPSEDWVLYEFAKSAFSKILNSRTFPELETIVLRG